MSTTIATTPALHIVTGTPIGPLTVVRDDEGLTGVYFPGHWTRPDQSAFGPRAEADDTRSFEETVAQLNEYLDGRRREFELPLAPHGDERAKAAWQLIARVPYGSTATYGSLASALGSGVTARQVGWYVGHNPLSIIIPCHRIIGADGSLTGYAGGLERKRHLLELEGAIQAAEPTLW